MQLDSDVIDRLTEIRAPTMVIVGERDRRYLASTELFEAKLEAEAIRVPDAGHHVHVTSAAVLVPQVEEFLARRTGSPTGSQ
jgi:pimeloyl-ACP methyl ester carboxylesterase